MEGTNLQMQHCSMQSPFLECGNGLRKKLLKGRKRENDLLYRIIIVMLRLKHMQSVEPENRKKKDELQQKNMQTEFRLLTEVKYQRKLSILQRKAT